MKVSWAKKLRRWTHQLGPRIYIFGTSDFDLSSVLTTLEKTKNKNYLPVSLKLDPPLPTSQAPALESSVLPIPSTHCTSYLRARTSSSSEVHLQHAQKNIWHTRCPLKMFAEQMSDRIHSYIAFAQNLFAFKYLGRV